MRGTTITLNGEERRLRYDLNAWAEIGDRLGLTVRIAHVQQDLLEARLPLRALRTVLWAGLIHENNKITEEEVGSWVDTDNMAEVLKDFFSHFGIASMVFDPEEMPEEVAEMMQGLQA